MVLKVNKKRSIGEISKEVGVHDYVIRFWETQFDCIKPSIGAGGRRYFFDKDVKILNFIKDYLYNKGYTVKGLQNLLKNENIDLDIDNKEEIINKEDKNIKNIDHNQDNVKAFELKNKDNFKKDMKDLRLKLNIFYDKLKNI